MKPSDFLTELSNEKLAQYKTAASADASKADSEGNFKKGDKRFKGINTATKKQFANDQKKVEEGVGLPSPGTYEETNDMFKSSGQRRIGTLTTEDDQIDGMAQGEIREIIKNAIHIKNQLDKGVSLDGWMYSYVTTSNDHLNSVAEQINNPNIDEQGVAEDQNQQPPQGAETLQQKQVRAAITKGMAKWDQSDLATYKSQPTNLHYFAASGWASGQLDGINSIDPDGTVVIELNDTTTAGLVKKLASLGGMPGVKTRQLKMTFDPAKMKNGMTPGEVSEEWSQKYKSSINCSHPKGFSQKAHCAGKKKHNESIPDYTNLLEMTCPDCGMCQSHGDNSKDKLDELKCWSGYHRVSGTKAGFPGSCAKNKTNEELDIEEDRENFNGINLLLQKDDEEVFVKASAGSRELGHVLFVIDGDYLMPQDLEVEERYRGQGIAQTMYDFVKSKGYKIRRSGQQTDAGAGFWAKHRPEQNVWEERPSESCPHCGGEMVSEELMNEKKDACYYKVKSRYKVWPSAYASGALVKCRNKGASNWGNSGKKNESSILEGIESVDESLHDWFNKEKWVRMDTKGNIKGPCAKEPGEGKPKCLPQAKAHSLGKKGRASAAARKRREDPNPDRSGKAINVNTKKEK
jgi:hypothetical protein